MKSWNYISYQFCEIFVKQEYHKNHITVHVHIWKLFSNTVLAKISWKQLSPKFFSVKLNLVAHAQYLSKLHAATQCGNWKSTLKLDHDFYGKMGKIIIFSVKSIFFTKEVTKVLISRKIWLQCEWIYFLSTLWLFQLFVYN